MATVEQCNAALHTLADRLATPDPKRRRIEFDRTMSCSIRDLHVIFTGRLKDGQLINIERSADRDAQIKLTMSSDDLVALVNGNLKMAAAWASGRVKVEAGVRDLLKLRSIF